MLEIYLIGPFDTCFKTTNLQKQYTMRYFTIDAFS